MSFLLTCIDSFVDNFFCVILLLLLEVRIHIFHFLVLTNVLKLFLPFSLSLSIDLSHITLSAKSYFGEADEFFRERLHLCPEVFVRLASLIDVLLDNLRVVVHSHLALAYGFNHISSLLGHALDHTLEILHSLHSFVILVRKEVVNIYLFLFLVYMMCRHLFLLLLIFFMDNCV